LWVLGLILGISSSFYWIGYHLEFAKFSDPRYRGREVGLANIVGSVLSIFAPAIGGLLIVAGGFVALFIVVLLVFILSIIPLFMSADIFPKKNIMFFKVFRKRSIRYDILPYIAEGVLGVAYADVWPLIVFLFFSTEYETLGILFTASFALSLIFTYIAGKLGDDGNVVKILKLGGVVNSVVWVGRMFINGVTSLFFVESFGGVTKPFWIVPVGHYFYERALKSKNLLEYILFKEFIVCVGAILFFVLLILFQDILVAPVISAIAGLLFLFV
jgi:MFS family permease